LSLDALLSQDSVTIQRPTSAKDASGGSTRLPFTDKAAEVPARVESLSSRQRLQYQQFAIPVTHRIFLPLGTDVDNGDVVQTSDGLVIRVIEYNENRPIGSMEGFLEVLGEQVRV
jgi:SPP1 family predicted phage head-tail adaptor